MLKWAMLTLYVAVSAFFLVQFGMWYHVVERLERFPWLHPVFVGLYVACASTLLLGRLLPSSQVQQWMLKFSNYWLGFLIFLTTFQILANLILVPTILIAGKHSENFGAAQKQKIIFVAGILVVLLAAACTVYGGFHARTIKTNRYTVNVQKSAGERSRLSLVLAADLHLGHSIGWWDMERMVEAINAAQPELVVLCGDIFDNDFDAVDDPDRIRELLRQIQAPLGVYAVYGNHDVTETLVGGFPIGNGEDAQRDERMEALLRSAGIITLQDESLLVDDSFYLVGRLDPERSGTIGLTRQGIEALTEGLDGTKPILVLNHEPDDITATAACGADLMLSGHTHGGQFFPLTVAQPFKWPVYEGVKVVDGLTVAVTTGVGVYGPPVRLGTDAEIMSLTINFEG